jgi:hypothetical protein
LSTEAIAEGFGENALARNAQELLFRPGKESCDLLLAQLLTRGMADVSGLTVDVAFDVVELADPVECLARDLGFGRCPKIMEVAPQMRLTGGFAQTQHATRFRHVKLGIAFVAVRLQNTAGIGQVAQDMLFLPVPPLGSAASTRPHP